MTTNIDKPYVNRPAWQALYTGEAQANTQDQANAFAAWCDKKSTDRPNIGTHPMTGSCLPETMSLATIFDPTTQANTRLDFPLP